MIKNNKKSDHEEFVELWNNLTYQQRKSRLNKAFLIIKNAAHKQLEMLKEINKDNNVDKNVGFIYFFNTVKNFWDHAEFAYSLGKGKNRKFCYFPARLLMETVLRLEFYINKNRKEQDDIAIKEMLRGCKRFYDRDKAEGRNFQEIKKYYDAFASNGTYPDIENANPNVNPFPNMWELTRNSNIEDSNNWYFHFQAMAESTHGKLLAIEMTNSNELGEYVRSMMLILLMCNKALLIIDKHIEGISNKIVVKSIENTDRIIKKPIINNKK